MARGPDLNKQFDEQDRNMLQQLFMARQMQTNMSGWYVAKELLVAIEQWERGLEQDEATQKSFKGDGGQWWQGAIRHEGG